METNKEDCLFCKMVKGEIPCKKIYEDDTVMAILDLHPSADGHTLIIPKKHFTDFYAIDDVTLNHVYDVAKKLAPTLINKMHAQALSLRINYGSTQEIKHFHLHLLPNYGIKKCTLSQSEAWNILKDSFK
jgi:histidine triad (HIT) family protein